MLTIREAEQIISAIKLMRSPMSQGGNETCWKEDVVSLLMKFVERLNEKED